jgi:hypothetical protein
MSAPVTQHERVLTTPFVEIDITSEWRSIRREASRESESCESAIKIFGLAVELAAVRRCYAIPSRILIGTSCAQA